MNKLIISVAVVLAILAVFAFMYLQRQTPTPVLEAIPPAEVEPQPAAATEPEEAPAVRYPVEEIGPPPEEKTREDVGVDLDIPVDVPDEEPPLPLLDDSDGELMNAIGGLVTEQTLEAMFRFDGFIRRLVVTIDNLPQKQLTRGKYRVTQPTGGRFTVQKNEGGELYVSPDNFRRYTPLVELIESLDSDRLMAVYLRYYPLFQEAYEYLGYPSAYFNDRLIDVIDHLLATPVVDGPIRLVRPHVLYKYADPDLESLSAGRKALIRIGPVNANRVKKKLREIRQILAGQSEAEQLSEEIETEMDLILDEGAESTEP